METVNLGKIRLGSEVRVTDPCYEKDLWCCNLLEGFLPGEYECFMEKQDEWACGTRVAELRIENTESKGIGEWQDTCIEVGVDSGQAGFFDREHYDECNVNDEFYHKVCELTLSDARGGTVDDCGVVSESGYGDGVYVCHVKRESNGYIVEAKIIFID